ncbi:MAG TPA: MinD/ParA family protein [Paraburkholderia sp.]
MDKFVIDQAEGLRRLLAREGPRVLAVTGAGAGVAAGRTTTVVNLAAALVAQGSEVVVIDECSGPRSVCETLGGVRAAGQFAALMRGDLSLADAMRRHALGFAVLEASREDFAPYTGAQLRKVLGVTADVVLIDAQLDAEGALSPLALHAHDLLIVMRTAAQSITETYACMKRLYLAHAIGQFRVLANAVSNPAEASIVFANLEAVASRYLTVGLQFAGCVAADPHMTRAQYLSRCVVDAFPSAVAARDYRQLAAELPHWPMRVPFSSRTPGASGGGDALAVARAEAFAARVTEDKTTTAGEANVPLPTHAGWLAEPCVQELSRQPA